MPWNGSGTFNRVYSWVADAAAGLDISSSRMDEDTDDLASSGFGNCLTRDGQGQATANLPMAGFRHTGAGLAVATTDYATLGQAQSGLSNWTAAAGSADVITATYTPAIAALTDGLVLHFRAAATNLTTTPTFSPNGLTAKQIAKFGQSASGFEPLSPGDIVAVAEVIVRYNAGQSVWMMVNPPGIPVGGCVPYFGGSIPGNYALPTGQNLLASNFPAANA